MIKFLGFLILINVCFAVIISNSFCAINVCKRIFGGYILFSCHLFLCPISIMMA